MPNLIVVVLKDRDKCDEMLSAWQAVGVPGATILDSIGQFQAKQMLGRDDLPLFPSLRNLLAPQESPQRTMFAVIGDDMDIDKVVAASEAVVGSFDEPNSGILFVVPVTHVRGLRRWP